MDIFSLLYIINIGLTYGHMSMDNHNNYIEDKPEYVPCSCSQTNPHKEGFAHAHGECKDRFTLVLESEKGELVDINCPKHRPYCNPDLAECVEVPYLGPFQCPREDGIFPMEHGCVGYYLCHNWELTLVNCDKNEHYNHQTGKCDPSIPCFEFDCNDKAGEVVAYPTDPSTVAWCSHFGVAAIDKCPEGFVLGNKENRLEIIKERISAACTLEKCNETGTIIHPWDDMVFYDCTWNEADKSYKLQEFFKPSDSEEDED